MSQEDIDGRLKHLAEECAWLRRDNLRLRRKIEQLTSTQETKGEGKTEFIGTVLGEK